MYAMISHGGDTCPCAKAGRGAFLFLDPIRLSSLAGRPRAGHFLGTAEQRAARRQVRAPLNTKPVRVGSSKHAFGVRRS